MKQDELKEVLRLHELWLDGEEDGERADLSRANLRGMYIGWANLERVDLYKSDLSGANLSDASLSEADLSGADLSDANLSDASLRAANLEGASLEGTNLEGAWIRWAIGDGKRIKTIFGLKYHVNIWDDMMSIGCRQYKIDEWFSFSDDRIAKMDDGALEWWNANKQFLKDFIERLKNEQ